LNYIPFIFLTAKSSDEDIRYGKELGVDDYFSKLAPPEDLLASIQGKLRRLKRQQLYVDLEQRHKQYQIQSELERDSSSAVSDIERERMFSLKAVIVVAIIAFILGWSFATGWAGGF